MPDFDQLYAAHFGSLSAQLYAYLGDRQEAQDAVQEAFCRALARWRTPPGVRWLADAASVRPSPPAV